jgi:hypothetical protein
MSNRVIYLPVIVTFSNNFGCSDYTALNNNIIGEKWIRKMWKEVWGKPQKSQPGQSDSELEFVKQDGNDSNKTFSANSVLKLFLTAKTCNCGILQLYALKSEMSFIHELTATPWAIFNSYYLYINNIYSILWLRIYFWTIF